MGSTAPKKDHNNPKYLKDLLELSQKTCKQYLNEKEDIILKKKEEINNFLTQKDLNSSKQIMEVILKEEDNITIFVLLNRIIETLKGKINLLIDSKECPPTLKASLNTILFSAAQLEIKELKEFREIIKEKYGQEYLSKTDNNEELLVNEVLVEKLKKNIYSEQLIKTRLRNICIEKNIDYQFLDINNEALDDQSALHPEELNNRPSLIIRKTRSIFSSSNSKLSLGNSSIKRSSLYLEEAYNKNINESNDDKYDKEFEELAKNDPLKRVKTIEDPNENLFIIKTGENMFLPYDEKIDEKCYKLNKMENWADSFYNLKSGILLKQYKELISKTEFSTFFEALNYEYGINNYPLDINKAFEIYKNAADNTTDTLSMYRLYYIYKRDYKKFNMNERNHVFEKFYIMKCYAFLTKYESQFDLFGKFDIHSEIRILLMDENRIFYDWYCKYFEFLKSNFSYYNIKKDDVILIESVIYYCFETKEGNTTQYMDEQIEQLAKKGNLHAMYNLAVYYNDNEHSHYLEKLYNMNYYRAFNDYAIKLSDKKEALSILKKSIGFGYLYHIKDYYQIFFEMYEIEDIVKSPALKSELMVIMNCLMDIIIMDHMPFLYDYIYIRNILIKHYNFEDEFKKYLDNNLKEIVNYIKLFFKGNNDENKNKILSTSGCFFYYQNFFTLYGFMNLVGIKGIMDKNYNETLNIYNYLLEHNEGFLDDRYYYYEIYTIKNKQRRINNHPNEKEDKELMALEKKVLNLFYEELSAENIKKLPPNFFYKLSKLFRNNAINTKDLILEYVFLNRASNSTIIETFENKYTKTKATKKIKEKNKEENFKKIKEAKGAINVEGYGENGMICPICMQNKKSIIALPCKHFFCGTCMDILLNDGSCPICRKVIKITFDFNLKRETLIKSFLPPKDEPFENDPFLVPELDIFD